MAEPLHESELQRRLIYSVLVAGKTAEFAVAAIDRLLPGGWPTPFDQVRQWSDIEKRCRKARTGNYGKLAKCLKGLITDCPALDTCTPQELERIHGIGPKTSRFFIMWTRTDAPYAALDVHVLRWLKKMGYDVPKATPQSTKRYAKIETWFIGEAGRRGVSPRELDHAIWVEGAKHEDRNPRTAELVKAIK